MTKALPSINELPDELLLRVFRLADVYEHIPECARDGVRFMPALHSGSPRHAFGSTRLTTLGGVQRRLPGAKVLTFQIYCYDPHKDVLAAEIEGALVTAHLLLTLTNAQSCKLRELQILQANNDFGCEYDLRSAELDDQVSKEISRFTLLTKLSLYNLAVEAGTLQALSGLLTLREFHCSLLRCPEHADTHSQRFSGAVAQALWTLALGWPQRRILEFINCALSSGEVSGNIETPPGTHQLRHLTAVGCGSASTLVSGISARQKLEDLAIGIGNSLGTTGKLRVLTSLQTQFYGQGPHYELHLENPNLQCLSVVGLHEPEFRDERMWQCLSHLTALQELCTRNLIFFDIPGGVLLLTCLTSLHHRSSLQRLSTDLSPLQNLMELDIYGSSLGCVPVITCQSLERLKMDRCDIGTEVTWEGICRLKALPASEESGIQLHESILTICSGDCAHGSRATAGGI